MPFLYLFTYLLLSHLLADFVFQPEALVRWKHKDWKGIFVHALIQFVTSLVFFWPFLVTFNVWGVGMLFVNAALHFMMDRDKIKMEKHDRRYVRLFFLDQIFHIAVLVAAAMGLAWVLKSDLFSVSELYQFFGNFLPFAIYLIVAVLSTYVYEIVKFQYTRLRGGTSLKFNYKHMFVRLMVLSLIFGLALFLSGYHIAKTFLF